MRYKLFDAPGDLCVAAAGFAGVRNEIGDVQDKVGIGCGQLEKIRDFLLYGFIQNRPFVCEAGGFGDCGIVSRRNLCYLCGGAFLLPLSRARTIAL